MIGLCATGCAGECRRHLDYVAAATPHPARHVHGQQVRLSAQLLQQVHNMKEYLGLLRVSNIYQKSE